MSIHFATNEELKNWDALVLNNPDGGNPLQLLTFSKLKQRNGDTIRYIVSETIAMSVIEKTVPLLGKLWYCPKGPGVNSAKELIALCPTLRTFAKKHGVFCVKLEPELLQEEAPLLEKAGIRKSYTIQPNSSTIVIDTTPDLEAIQMGFSQTARRNIRAAQRLGGRVVDTPINSDTCKQMYQLYEETSRGNFIMRPYGYCKWYWQQFASAGQGKFFFAYDAEGTLCAAAFIIVAGKKALYKDGASTRHKTTQGISYLLQSEIMRYLHEVGCEVYDLHGTPRASALEDTQHPYYGLGRFKMSFNKNIVEYVGTYSLAVGSVRTMLWDRFFEKVVRRVHSKIKGTLYY